MLNIDELIAIGPNASALLHQQQSGSEVIRISEHAGLRWVHTSEQTLLSAFRPDDPATPVFPNHRCMLCALLLCAQPASVLNLGFGVGSFERYFQRHLAHISIESVDTSSALVELSRQWFQIPNDWPVIIAAAHDHLLQSGDTFDLVLCDIFIGDTHPPCLFEADFYAAAAKRLHPDGVLALNLSPESDDELLRILLAVRTSFANVMLSTLSGHGNVVVLASREAFAEITELRRRAQRQHLTPDLDLLDDINRFTRLPQPES
ncbi:MAG: spermidine synthase [Gammaproteobacteria bacterium]|jgi:spermidine synthase